MSSVECPAPPQRSVVETFRRTFSSPRLLVYAAFTLLVLATGYRLGKDVQWDTMDYHLYAGFSALHDRFGLDYFAAGPQAYLNPYAYAPFYLLVTSGLSALEVGGILAVIQSGLLWLTYELALAVGPQDRPRGRIALGVCAALLALSNPVLLEQFGSSFADITTAELVLAGALLLVGALRTPGAWRLAGAGLLLGAASALKLSNSLDAASLAIVPLFVPAAWPKRLRAVLLYGLGVGLSFALVSLPWSIQLQRHFGNPFFPLFNGFFRSPQFTTAGIEDFRFIPASFLAALWRPFAMMEPVRLVHFERPAPDLRYALLIVLAALVVAMRWLGRSRGEGARAREPRRPAESRALLALGCAFLLNWVLWLAQSGNSRYFIPMSCVAAVLVVALTSRLLMAWPRALTGVVAAILLAQFHQVWAGAMLREPYPWGGGHWFEVSIPQPLASQAALYFSVGVQSSSFVVPYLPAGSGFVNLEGDYLLGPDGANGARIRQLITRFSPHLRVLVADTRVDASRERDFPHLPDVDDAVEPFGLRVDAGSCARIVARTVPSLEIVTVNGDLPKLPRSQWYTDYLVTCRLVPGAGQQPALAAGTRTANLVLDRLEDSCPGLLQPRRPQTYFIGSDSDSLYWIRRYTNTDTMAWVHSGRVGFRKVIGQGRPQDVGSVQAWQTAPLQVACGRRNDDDFFRILPRH